MTVNQMRKTAAHKLADSGVGASGFEADVLIEAALDIDRTRMICDLQTELSQEQIQSISALVVKRAEGYPLQYIVGKWEFYGYEFFVGEGVLIPRADTEVLVDTAKKLLSKITKPVVFDLCSGTGCIAVTLEKELDASVFALEKSADAYRFLLKNIRRNKSRTVPELCDVLDKATVEKYGMADMIVSNPPYIKSEALKTLSKEVGYEPKIALDGDSDGLKFYRGITSIWKDKIKKGGYLLYEIGYDQKREVERILTDNGFSDVTTVYDLGENPRAVYGRK